MPAKGTPNATGDGRVAVLRRDRERRARHDQRALTKLAATFTAAGKVTSSAAGLRRRSRWRGARPRRSRRVRAPGRLGARAVLVEAHVRGPRKQRLYVNATATAPRARPRRSACNATFGVPCIGATASGFTAVSTRERRARPEEVVALSERALTRGPPSILAAWRSSGSARAPGPTRASSRTGTRGRLLAGGAPRLLRRALRRRRGRLALLPPALAGDGAKWAERTPDGFVFHAKASGEMTGHEEADRETAFREFREAFEPLEAVGEAARRAAPVPPALREVGRGEGGARGRRAAARPAAAAGRVPPPLVDGGGRARRHARVPRAPRARLRLGRLAAYAGDERPAPRRRRDGARRLRPLPRAQLEDLEHPRRALLGRPLRLDVLGGGAGRVGRAARELAERPRRSTR